MDGTWRTVSLVGAVVVILLLLHLLPPMYIEGNKLRDVNILSDLTQVHHDSLTDHTIAIGDIPVDSTRKNQHVWPDSITPIEDFSKDGDGMRHFYEALNAGNDLKRPTRVAYFGDSFIEADIFTCDLRELLQARFGGMGPGWIDFANPLYNYRTTINQTANGTQEFQVMKKPFNIALEGINERYYTATDGATVTTSGTPARQHGASWTNATLFFRTQGGVSITASGSGQQTFGGSAAVQQMQTRGGATMQSITYTITEPSPETYFFGMALEGTNGVNVDNFSMRGSGGGRLAEMPQNTLDDFARLRPYDLIVLHFGLNVASRTATAKTYEAYINSLGTAIERLRATFPEASILVVSVSDRDERTADGIHTMRGVQLLRKFQRKMAYDHHVCFYDLFAAMGGEDSLAEMVKKKMAASDYTHMTYDGGAMLAKKMYQSMMTGLNFYNKDNNNE